MVQFVQVVEGQHGDAPHSALRHFGENRISQLVACAGAQSNGAVADHDGGGCRQKGRCCGLRRHRSRGDRGCLCQHIDRVLEHNRHLDIEQLASHHERHGPHQPLPVLVVGFGPQKPPLDSQALECQGLRTRASFPTARTRFFIIRTSSCHSEAALGFFTVVKLDFGVVRGTAAPRAPSPGLFSACRAGAGAGVGVVE
eukprot:scaffold1068_cov375-Prasinococcus_capsulatus_cf.AAC.23